MSLCSKIPTWFTHSASLRKARGDRSGLVSSPMIRTRAVETSFARRPVLSASLAGQTPSKLHPAMISFSSRVRKDDAPLLAPVAEAETRDTTFILVIFLIARDCFPQTFRNLPSRRRDIQIRGSVERVTRLSSSTARPTSEARVGPDTPTRTRKFRQPALAFR